jgi:putative endonuclease
LTSESGPAATPLTDSGATWWVYLLRCADGTLYTGITTDLIRRLAEHNGDGAAGARYTRSRRPVQLVYREAARSRSAASQREAAIKRLDRARKLALCTAST